MTQWKTHLWHPIVVLLLILTSTASIAASQPAAPALTVEKRLASPADRDLLFLNEVTEFQVVITNTGDTAIAYLPLQDNYDTACLAFREKGSPEMSIHDPNTGTIIWSDLTLYMVGGRLHPGQQTTVTLTFDVVGSTPSGLNQAVVAGAQDELGQPIPVQVDAIAFTCVSPTGIFLPLIAR